MTSLTRADIAEEIFNKTNYSKKESADLVWIVFDIVRESLARGESVKLSGFGQFFIKHKKPRRGRNPKNGEKMQIKARKVLSFRVSNLLKEDIGSRYSHRLKDDGSEDKTQLARKGSFDALGYCLPKDDQ